MSREDPSDLGSRGLGLMGVTREAVRRVDNEERRSHLEVASSNVQVRELVKEKARERERTSPGSRERASRLDTERSLPTRCVRLSDDALHSRRGRERIRTPCASAPLCLTADESHSH